VTLQLAHRPQPCFQPRVICLDRVGRMLLNGMQGRGHQFDADSRIDGCTVGGDLDRDRANAQRPREEAPGGCQVAPQRQQDVDDLAILVCRPVR
jgi:hypothetical protein